MKADHRYRKCADDRAGHATPQMGGYTMCELLRVNTVLINRLDHLCSGNACSARMIPLAAVAMRSLCFAARHAVELFLMG